MNAIQPFQGEISPEEVQRARLCLSSSSAVALLETEAPIEEVKAALGPDERAALPVALRALDAELAPARRGDNLDAAIASEIMRASVLLAPHLDQEKRADWASATQAEFDAEPAQLVLEGIAAARKICRHPNHFVPDVMAFVTPRRARIEAERARYEELNQAA